MKRYLFCLIVLVFVSSAFAQGRVTKSFDNDWLFMKGEQSGGETFEFKDDAWRKLDVPHDWSIEGPFDAKNPTLGSGGYLPSGTGWYRKHFPVSANNKDKRVFIEFDGVMANSDVWINGVHLGKRPYGYVSFGYELTDNIRFGADNVIAVRVDNSGQPASRWYTGAGIYRHVRLVIKSPLSIVRSGIFVTTSAVSADQALVRIETTVSTLPHVSGVFSVVATLYDSKGKAIETRTADPKWVAGSMISTEFTVKKPNRWDLTNPAL